MITFHVGDSASMTAFIISYVISMLFSMGMTALMMVSCWHIFKKLGMPGWKGIIPFYSDYMLFKTVWKTKPFWVTVIAAGVYLFASIISSIILIIVLAANSSSGSSSAVTAAIVVFFIVLGLLTLAVSVIAIVITVKLNFRLAKEFGKGTGFALGLSFISVVFYPILAFGKSQRVSA